MHASLTVSCCTHATPTWRPPGPWPLLAKPDIVVLTSLKRGAPKAPARLGRWAVRRFVWACDVNGHAGFA